MRETNPRPAPRAPRGDLWSIARLWPWRAAAIAWLVMVVLVGLVRHHYTGIYGFSMANYGWLAFTIVGGAGLAWRLAGRPPWPLALARPLLAAAVAFVFCMLAVIAMGLIFLPGRPLQGGGDTAGPLGGLFHPMGRAFPVAMVVVLLGYACELLRGMWALAGNGPRDRRRRGGGSQ